MNNNAPVITGAFAACGGYFLKAANGIIKNGPVPCKRWDCNNPACGPAKLKYYYAVLCNGLGVHNGLPIPKGENVTLITITTDPKKWDNKPQAWDKVGYSFKLLRQRIYRHYGKFEYIAVLEATKAGWPHLHIVCKGIDKIPQGWHEEYINPKTGKWELVTRQSDKEGNKWRIIRPKSTDGRPTLSEMADDSGFGEVCDVRSVKFDNAKGAANYLLGYLEKSLNSTRYPPNARRVRYTPGWLTEEWEKQKEGFGTGLIVPEEWQVDILRRYVERNSNDDIAPEEIIWLLRQIGPQNAAKRLLQNLPLDFDGVID